MERGETKGKVIILKEGKHQSDDKCNKVRYWDDKYLDIYDKAVERVHCDKCQIQILLILFHTGLFPSRKFLMPSVNKNLKEKSEFLTSDDLFVNRYQQKYMEILWGAHDVLKIVSYTGIDAELCCFALVSLYLEICRIYN